MRSVEALRLAHSAELAPIAMRELLWAASLLFIIHPNFSSQAPGFVSLAWDDLEAPLAWRFLQFLNAGIGESGARRDSCNSAPLFIGVVGLDCSPPVCRFSWEVGPRLQGQGGRGRYEGWNSPLFLDRFPHDKISIYSMRGDGPILHTHMSKSYKVCHRRPASFGSSHAVRKLAVLFLIVIGRE